MQIVYGEKLNKEKESLVSAISQECGVLKDTARLLVYRNIQNVEQAKNFLNPSKNNFHNPYLFSQMQTAVDVINEVVNKGGNILIFGDYDADGICATTTLNFALNEMGITPILIVPERDDGYGLSVEKILSIHSKTPIDLLITVDCGISEKQAIEQLKEKGICVIVTDHHEPPNILPDCIIINPKTIGETYPFDGLCGAGVAYKLATALIGEKAEKYLDIVAVATVADSMQLTGENRDIVFEGLKLFNNGNMRPVFKYLLGESDKQVNAGSLAWVIAPRVNAGGRMGDANASLKLFISKDENQIKSLSKMLNEYNVLRQTECERVFEQAILQIKQKELYRNPAICVVGEDWSAGVVGIVASKVVEAYNRPAIIFAKQDGHLKGSARSVDHINIFNAIDSAKEHLIDFGGHSQAAGVSVEIEKFEHFYGALNEYIYKLYGDVELDKKIYCDWEIKTPVSLDFAREINLLEPFGVGNKKPVFCTEVDNLLQVFPLKENSPHYTFYTKAMQMLYFNAENSLELLNLPVKKKIIFDVNYSVFRSTESVKGFVKQVIPDYNDLAFLSPYLLRDQLLNLLNEQCELKEIDYKKGLVEKGYGTVYAISNVETLNKYDTNGLSIHLFSPEQSAGRNCIVFALRDLPEEYKKVVYLDKPIACKQTHAEQYLVKGINAFESLKNLDFSRETFGQIYNYLCGFCDKPFYNSAWFVTANNCPFDKTLVLIASEVFLELGFFTIEKGKLIRQQGEKNALTNSVIYSKILNIKGV